MTNDQTNDVGAELIRIVFKNYRDEAQTQVKNHLEFSVKTEFAKNNPDYDKKDPLELFRQTDMHKFLHNTNGPAVIDFINNLKTYILDGQILTEDSEDFKKIKHNESFYNKVDKLLEE